MQALNSTNTACPKFFERLLLSAVFLGRREWSHVDPKFTGSSNGACKHCSADQHKRNRLAIVPKFDCGLGKSRFLGDARLSLKGACSPKSSLAALCGGLQAMYGLRESRAIRPWAMQLQLWIAVAGHILPSMTTERPDRNSARACTATYFFEQPRCAAQQASGYRAVLRTVVSHSGASLWLVQWALRFRWKT